MSGFETQLLKENAALRLELQQTQTIVALYGNGMLHAPFVCVRDITAVSGECDNMVATEIGDIQVSPNMFVKRPDGAMMNYRPMWYFDARSRFPKGLHIGNMRAILALIEKPR